MIRICFLADGGSIHTRRWCEHFAGRGFEVHLITFRNAEIPGTTVHLLNAGNIKVSGGNWQVLKKIFTLKKLIRQIKPDILHAHYATSYGLLGALSGFHPYVVTALGTDVLISPFESRLYKMVLKYVFRKADWITAMADHMRDTIIKIGAEPNKVSTVIFGINPEIFNAENRILPEGKFVITSTRNFEKVYNIPDLIDAIAIARNSIPGLELNLIGAGSTLPEIEQKIAAHKLQDIVKLYGRVSQLEIAAVLNKSHLFVSVSSSDGNNISLNEAMACGCFSVVTDIPANRQWISEGINGFFVPLNNVESLAAKIIEYSTNFSMFSDACKAFNQQAIQEKGIWNTNMDVVEKKYLNFINNEKT
jgi:L-malate glycosyltransferase